MKELIIDSLMVVLMGVLNLVVLCSKLIISPIGYALKQSAKYTNKL